LDYILKKIHINSPFQQKHKDIFWKMCRHPKKVENHGSISAFLNPNHSVTHFFTKTGSRQKNSPLVVYYDQFYLPPFFKKGHFNVLLQIILLTLIFCLDLLPFKWDKIWRFYWLEIFQIFLRPIVNLPRPVAGSRSVDWEPLF
jgi:hypothetical protein